MSYRRWEKGRQEAWGWPECGEGLHFSQSSWAIAASPGTLGSGEAASRVGYKPGPPTEARTVSQV